jgi:hypothetical protein
VGDDRHVVGLAEVGDLLGRGDAAHAVDVELHDVEGAQVERLAEAVERVLVLSARDRDVAQRPQLGVAGEVVGDHRLLDPAQAVRLEHPEHPARILQGPAHIAVGHDVHTVAHRLARGAHEVEVLVHPGHPVLGAPAEAQLDRAEARLGVGLGLRVEGVEGLGVEAARVDRDLRLGPAAQEAEDG